MYPPQTSLIPATVAIVRYVAQQGFIGNYPYWYSGSTPLNYLTGPVLPTLLIVIRSVFNLPSFFEASYFLLLSCFIVSLLGWFFLLKGLTKNGKVALISVVVLTILPWKYFFSMVLADLPYTVARSLLPFILIVFYLYKGRGTVKFWAVVAGSSFLLLIDSTVLADLALGFIALGLYKSFHPRSGRFVKISKYLIRVVKILALAVLVSSIWYSPGYWLTILANPSTGGVSGAGAVVRVFDLIKAAMPVIAAVVVVIFSNKLKSRYAIFLSVWFCSFAFLTLFRFISDYDYWQDWSIWIYQLEVGGALLIGYLLYKKIYFVLQISVGLFIVLISGIFYNHFNRPALISGYPPSYMESITQLAQITGNDNLVFLSGSSVYWINAFNDVKQVRGGVDRVSADSFWPKAAWVIRESNNTQETGEYLKRLGVKYVLLHTSASDEFYQDFRFQNKWNGLGEVVFSSRGDKIIKIF